MASERQELKVIIRAKDVFSRTMNKAIKGLQAITRVAKIAAVAVGGVAAAFAAVAVTTAKAGDEFQKMALRTGLSTQALSEMKKALELSGTSIEAFEKGVKTLAKRISDANFGLETYQRVFRALNVEYKTSSGALREVDEVFLDAADAINKLSSETAKAAFSTELFGRAGTQMLPLIKAGRDGIEEMRESARRLGITFTQLEADQAAAFTDRLSDAKDAVKGLWFSLGKQLIPTFTVLLEKFTTFLVDSPLVTKSINFMTNAVKALAESLGVDAFTALEKVNQEIAFMQTADAFSFFETGAAHAAEMNRLLLERTRLIELNAEAEEEAKKKRIIIDLDAPIVLTEEEKRIDAAFALQVAGEERAKNSHFIWGTGMVEIDNDVAKKRLAIAGGMSTAIASSAESLFTILGGKSRDFLKVVKATAIAQAIIEAKTAAVSAWEKGMTIGGPPLAVAFTAASLLKTGALIASIGGSQGGDVGNAPGITPSIGQTSAAIAPAQAAQAPVINIEIHTPTGEIPQGFIEEIMSGIDTLSTQNIFISDRALGRA